MKTSLACRNGRKICVVIESAQAVNREIPRHYELKKLGNYR